MLFYLPRFSWLFMFLHFWLFEKHSLAFPYICACLLSPFGWLCMFLRFCLLQKHSFSISLHLCLFIGRVSTCYACLRASGCSLSTPLVSPCVCALFIGRHLAAYAWFWIAGGSISTNLVFSCNCTCLLAVL